MRVFGWLRLLLRDEGSGGGRDHGVARNQRVRAGSVVRMTGGEWRGEEAIVDWVKPNGDMEVRLIRNGRRVPTGTNKVEVLTRSTTPNQVAVRRGMEVRVNAGEWRGRVATVTDVASNGKIWARITGGSTSANADPGSLRGKEIRLYEHQVDVIGRG